MAARQAATVIVLRDTAAGPEVFLMRRVRTMAFAAGMHVFPGGSVDDDDFAVPINGLSSADRTALDVRLSATAGLGAALLAAAARETFEECGVLLALPDNQSVDVALATGFGRWSQRRQSLIDKDRTFSQLLIGDELGIDSSAIRPWSHWVTPEVEPRRFDTRFFVAALPAHQDAHDLGGEADSVEWVRPAQALERHSRGELAMLLPTAATLESLTPFESSAQVMAAADSRSIRPLMPAPVGDGEQWHIVDERTREVVQQLDFSPLLEHRGINQ